MRNKKGGRRNGGGRFLSVFLFVAFILTPVFITAVDTSTELELQFSTSPEARLILRQSFVFPFLQGSGPLTKDNNLAAVLSADVTPVSVNGIAEINWTPAAFFVLSAGTLLGSGWILPFGDGIGIGVSEPIGSYDPDVPRRVKSDGEAFDGLLWRVWGAATFQFDLGAVIPGDWNHVLFQTRQEFRYAGYTRAGPDDFWVYENDERENKNGWVYYASYAFGYRMPLSPVLTTIAFMAEMYKTLYYSPGGDIWREDLGRWFFSGIFDFTLNPKLNATLVFQFRTRRNFGASDLNSDDYYYPDITLNNDEPYRLIMFYRIALVFTYKFR